MKKMFLLSGKKKRAKRIAIGFGFALALAFVDHNSSAQEVNLGTANNFEVLSAAGITSTGTTLINGNVGTTPITGAAITGLTAGQVNGTIYTTDLAGPAGSVMDPGLLTTAMGAVTTAYNQAVGLASGGALAGTIGTLTLTPGVYTFSSSALLTGKLTLNDEGLTDPVFVFQVGSALTTATGSSVVEENLGPNTIAGTSIFWQVGSSATLGTDTAFDGNILAYTSITADTGATDLDGRLLAMGGGGVGGAVTLDDNTLTAPPAEEISTGGGTGAGSGSTVPDTGSALLLLGSALAILFAFGRRFSV